jgi:TonB family protein
VAYHTIAAYYWEKAYRDAALTAAQKREYIELGLRAADQAIALNPDYVDALTYKNLLLRSQALLESDLDAQKRLIAEANELRNRAIEIRKQRQSEGVPTDTYPPPPPPPGAMIAAAPAPPPPPPPRPPDGNYSQGAPPPPPPPPTAKKVSAAAPVPPGAPPPPPPPDTKLTTAAEVTVAPAVDGATPGTRVYEKGQPGITMPVVLSETRPEYTGEAMRAKIEGTVTLSCVVETDGTVREVTVVRSLDPALDGQAVLAARKWQFRSGTKDGKPVRVRVTLSLTFTLR